MIEEKLLDHIKYVTQEWYETGRENLRLRDEVEELKSVLEKSLEENAQFETERIAKYREIDSLKTELQQKRVEISELVVKQNGGPAEYPIDDLPDEY